MELTCFYAYNQTLCNQNVTLNKIKLILVAVLFPNPKANPLLFAI